MFKKSFAFTLLYVCAIHAMAQQTVVTGRVMEHGKNEPLPFVSIGLKGTTIGTTSDFEGNYKLTFTHTSDTLVFSYMGYVTLLKKIHTGKTQHLDVVLHPSAKMMKEVVIKPKLNPALRIVNKAIKMREVNDYTQLNNYQYQSYNKADVAMNNISEKMKQNKLLQPLKHLFDSVNQMRNEDGKFVLPIFVSETYSTYTYQANPSKSKEVIEATRATGFGINEGSYVLDMLGSSLLQFNFNENWMRIMGKDFISPLAANAHNYYLYTLRDSTFIDGVKCYEIKLEQRRASDLGFWGTMWIADSTFALRRISAELSASANINFVERLKIQQEQQPTTDGPWIPTKTRAIVELSRITENSSGFVAKLYRANTNVKVNQPINSDYFDVAIDRSSVQTQADSAYWQNHRPEALTDIEQQMINRIDSVKNLPVVRTYTEVIRIITEGYYQTGKVDWGPYIQLVNFNKVEGLRFRLGFRTNQLFSTNWYYRGYLAYGTKDQKIKYGLGVERILSQRKWTTLGLHYKNDNDMLGVTDPSSAPLVNFGAGNNNLFSALNMGSHHARINKTIDYRLVFIRQLSRDFTLRVSAQNTYFKPLGKFKFAYWENEGVPRLRQSFTYTAVSIDIRFAYKELLMNRGNRRFRVKLAQAPVTTLTFAQGFKHIASSNFRFSKIQLNFNQHLTTGFLGNADYNITAGKIIGKLPYPMLEVMRGNTTFIGADNNFNLMNLYEFVADEYIHAWYLQHFEGLFFNRIPVVKKWKLRNYAVVKAAYGNLSASNKSLLPPEQLGYLPINEFKNYTPYLEAGYGIENLFRFVTLGAVHRLTYLNNTRVRKWGINVGLVFNF